MSALSRMISLTAGYYVRRHVPTIVYSQERTGCVALYESLREHGELSIVTHYLDPAGGGEQRLSGSARWAARHVIGSGRRFRVITLVRDPIDHMLSTFARAMHDRAVRATGNPDAPAGDIVPLFGPEFLERRGYMRQLGWFDGQFQRDLGVDVYAHPFDRSQGYARIAAPRCDVLVLRTELDDAMKGRLVAEFIGCPGFSMSKELTFVRRRFEAPGTPGEISAYAESYKALKRSAVIPDEHWREISGSRFVTHFFRREELEASGSRYARSAEVREPAVVAHR